MSARRRAAPARACPDAAAPGQAGHFAPGHFLALVRKHDWPPSFQSQLDTRCRPDWSAISTANRERRVALGDTGTIVGLTQRADEMMRQRMLATLLGRGR